MSEHQQGKLERRESEQNPSIHPSNKKNSAGASPWVIRKLNEHIRSKQREFESHYPTQLPNLPESLYLEEDSPLRRAASEPGPKPRLKRSASGTQNPLQHKTSAPPAVRASDPMGGSFSSTPVSKRSFSEDKIMNRQESETYSTSSPHQEESPVHAGVQNTILWNRHEQPLFVFHSPVPPVPVVMPHRPLIKSRSAPSFFHAQTIMITHSMYQQQWPQGLFQQHTETNIHLHPETQSSLKVPLHRVRPGSLIKQRDRAREDLYILSESPHGDSCCNQPGVLQHSACCDVHRKDMYHQNLARVHSSPGTFDRSLLSHLSSPPGRDVRRKPKYTTGLVFADYQMLKHECACKDASVDPRIKSIWSRLKNCGFVNQCKLVEGRPATFEELLSVHSEQLIHRNTGFSKGTFSIPYQSEAVLNNSCSAALLKMSVGSVISLAFRVAGRELNNGFAVVTPPGHQASHSQPYDLSMFNSVAIAAKQLQEQLQVKKILIVDWDVHHGSGTEEIFYTDPSVLYISLHHYNNNSSFFLQNGQPTRVGSDGAEGYNVNVAWSGSLNAPMGDAEYLAAFRTVVMPIARQFSPDVVLVSAGFNAAEGHTETEGVYRVSPNCFGFMTRKLMELAEGRVVLVLEGGYEPTSLCDAWQACVSALVGNQPEPLDEKELKRKPCINAVESLKTVLHIQSKYWNSVSSMVNTVSLPYVDAERICSDLPLTVPSSSRFLNEPMEHDEADSL